MTSTHRTHGAHFAIPLVAGLVVLGLLGLIGHLYSAPEHHEESLCAVCVWSQSLGPTVHAVAIGLILAPVAVVVQPIYRLILHNPVSPSGRSPPHHV